MPTPKRPLSGFLAGCLLVAGLAGCAETTPIPTQTQPPMVDGDWIGHSQALTAAGATPLTHIGDLVADPAGCLSLVGSDYSRKPPTGMVWTATLDCTTLSAQWQTTVEFATGTELTDITIMPTDELIAVGNGLDANNAPITGVVAIRDTDGRWATATELGEDSDGPMTALAIERVDDDLMIAGQYDGNASVWLSSDGYEWERHALPVDKDLSGSQANTLATDGKVIVVAGRGQDEDGETTTLMWNSSDGGRTWNETALPKTATADFRIGTLVHVVGGRGFLAIGSTRSKSIGLTMYSSDGESWKLEQPPTSGPLDVAIPIGDGRILIIARPLGEDNACGVIGMIWRDRQWRDYDLPCAEAGQARGVMLDDGTIALILGDELWLREPV